MVVFTPVIASKNRRLPKRKSDMASNHATTSNEAEITSRFPTSRKRQRGTTDIIPRWRVGLVCGAVAALLMASASADELDVKKAKPATPAIEAKPVEAKQVLEI